jgi:hypothetical protein
VQIRLEDAFEVQTKHACYLNDQAIRFQLERPREPSTYQRFFMGEYSSVDDVFPKAPDRKAVESDLVATAKTLDAALARMRGCPFGESGTIASRQDLLSFNIDHFCRPGYLYTNGQDLVSLVQRNKARFEVVYHRSLWDFRQFNSDYGWSGGLIEPECAVIVGTFEDAERAALERLAQVKTIAIRARKASEVCELLLQPAGERKDASGHPLETLIASFRSQQFRVQMGGTPNGPHERYRVLNELRPDGFVLEVCATCRCFRFTGMIWEFSGGSLGYCTHGLDEKDWKSGQPPMVDVLDCCPEYSFVEDGQRPIPYLRREPCADSGPGAAAGL